MIRILVLASLLAFPAYASQPIVVNSGAQQTAVVELYTSEGCSSCPPADQWLSKLVETPDTELDVLALSFHVDYWDYLGWKDRFSSAEYTRRQRMLGANNRQRTCVMGLAFVSNAQAHVEQTLDAVERKLERLPEAQLVGVCRDIIRGDQPPVGRSVEGAEELWDERDRRDTDQQAEDAA